MDKSVDLLKRFHALAEELMLRGYEYKDSGQLEVAIAYFRSSQEISRQIIKFAREEI